MDRNGSAGRGTRGLKHREIVAWALAVALGGLTTQTQAGDARATLPRPVSASQCRVKLLDDVPLASERSGIVEETVTEGATVEAGQVVVRLKDHIARAAMAVSEREAGNDIEVRFSRKATELAQMKYVRAVDANKAAPGAVSDLELRELRLAAEKSLLQLEQAEHHFLVAGLKRDEQREVLKAFRIESPLSGTVLEVFCKPGQVVREGEPILRLATTKRLRAEGYLSLDDLAAVRCGNPVDVQIEAGERGPAPAATGSFVGRVSFLDVKLEPVTQKVKFWAEVANRKGLLRDGMMVTLKIDTSKIDEDFVAQLGSSRRRTSNTLPRSTAASSDESETPAMSSAPRD
jgi:multidrug efflux pump subunit AcrA (membrane-fusion protein)